MELSTIKLSYQDNISIITLSRPKALNALNSRFFHEMHEALNELEKNEKVRVLVITGEGKAFAAGADIAEMAHMDKRQGTDFSLLGQEVFARLENFRTPVIAAVNGYALGGGCELAAACDFRIASSKALFGQPEVKLGLIPGYAGTQRLPRLIGTANALYLLLTGENIDADRAKEIGLVQMVTDADNLMIKVMDIAATISAQGPKAISMVKKTLRQGLAKDFVSAQKLEAERFGSLFKTEETTEGISAFLEKRKPNW